jgi:hypothetical protein
MFGTAPLSFFSSTLALRYQTPSNPQTPFQEKGGAEGQLYVFYGTPKEVLVFLSFVLPHEVDV